MSRPSAWKGYRRYAWLPALAATVAVYLGVRHGVPMVPDDAVPWAGDESVSHLAWVFALPFALLTLYALARVVADWRQSRRRVRDADLEHLDWNGFERLVGEMYRQRGYSLVEAPRQPRGGIDFMLAQGAERWLVQCGHWQSRKVRKATVRALANVVGARGAAGGIIITTGRFTPPARALAGKAGIRLVDGEQLADELLALAAEPGLEDLHPAVESGAGGDAPMCPQCGGDMIKRAAGHDDRDGGAFWGCVRYPDCDGLVAIEGAPAAEEERG